MEELKKITPGASLKKGAFNFVTTHDDTSPEYADYYITKFVLMQFMGMLSIPEDTKTLFDYELSVNDVLANEKVKALLCKYPTRETICDVSMLVKNQAYKVKDDDIAKKKIGFYEVNYGPWMLKELLAKSKAKKVFQSIGDIVASVDKSAV